MSLITALMKERVALALHGLGSDDRLQSIYKRLVWSPREYITKNSKGVV